MLHKISKIVQNREEALMWRTVYYAEELLQESGFESHRRELYSGKDVCIVFLYFKNDFLDSQMLKIERPHWTFDLRRLDLPIIGLKIKERSLKKTVKESIRHLLS